MRACCSDADVNRCALKGARWGAADSGIEFCEMAPAWCFVPLQPLDFEKERAGFLLDNKLIITAAVQVE
jgi:hypothetical protein